MMPTEQYTLAKPAQLNGGISATATSFTVRSQPTWPQSGQFRVRGGLGQTNEEIMVVAGGSGFSWTILQRGAEGTTPAAHNDWEEFVQVLTPGGLAGLIGGGVTGIAAGEPDPNGFLYLIWLFLKQVNTMT